ncbi:YdiU family protein [bacterium]|nr:YdiU family protein [bacterium]
MELIFDDLWVRTLPGEQDIRPGSRQVYGQCYSRVLPTAVRKPGLIAWSAEAAQLLDWTQSPEMAEILGGNRVLESMKPYAACYGGHQFGHWAGQLGDGRAMTLGEVVNGRGERWEVQLKGAGPTPYSRRADGRAVLRSSVREFLCSEAMFHLGIPTTRALALVGTGEGVMRDMFYDGHPELEPGAVVTRLAPTFVRFGNFEIFASRNEVDVLRQLTEFVIEQHYPQHRGDIYAFYDEVCRRTAELMADWMRVGFVHGVMNTDNLSILGWTIDYGPYGWLDPYQLDFTPNTTDRNLRYSYANQPRIGQWNLARLAEALLPLVGDEKPLQASLDHYLVHFEKRHRENMWAKIGLPPSNDPLLADLLNLLEDFETDMTIFFRNLARVRELEAEGLPRELSRAFYGTPSPEYIEKMRIWLLRYLGQARDLELMNRVNPSLIPRNYLVQQVIDRCAAGDAGAVNEFLQQLRQPYRERAEDDPLFQPRPDWARNRPGCSALSCSS